MCSTACCTDFAPGRPSWAYSAACVGRSRAMPNSTATKKPLSATRTNARTIRAAVTRAGLPYGGPAASVSDGRRVVGDDRDRRLLGLDGVAAAEPQPDRLGVQEAEDLLVLGLLRARRIAPRVPPALVGLDAEPAAHLGVQPLRHA